MTPFDLTRFSALWDRITGSSRQPATHEQILLVEEAKQYLSQAARALPSNIPPPPREVVDLQAQREKLLRERKDTGPVKRRLRAVREHDLKLCISARQAKGNPS